MHIRVALSHAVLRFVRRRARQAVTTQAAPTLSVRAVLSLGHHFREASIAANSASDSKQYTWYNNRHTCARGITLAVLALSSSPILSCTCFQGAVVMSYIGEVMWIICCSLAGAYFLVAGGIQLVGVALPALPK